MGVADCGLRVKKSYRRYIISCSWSAQPLALKCIAAKAAAAPAAAAATAAADTWRQLVSLVAPCNCFRASESRGGNGIPVTTPDTDPYDPKVSSSELLQVSVYTLYCNETRKQWVAWIPA